MSLDVSVKRSWKGFILDMNFRSGGDMLGILGASGSGKSMTLKCIAGVETPDSGRIAVGERVLYSSEQRINLRPQQRRIGYLFQDYALFPNMTVEDNIACALQHIPRGDRGSIISDMLARFRLVGLGGRYPSQLSGGQQQRVALARILAYEPDALLLDEPFSALDSYLKEQLQVELIDLLRSYRGDVVMVTHSRDEVYRFCRQMLVMDNGRCIASGDTREMFDKPRLLSVALLTGCKNISRAVPTGKNSILAADWGITLEVPGPIPAGTDHVGIRAHDFRPTTKDSTHPNCFPVNIREELESPFEWNILFSAGDDTESIWWARSKEAYHSAPEYLEVDPERILLLSSDEGAGE